MIAWLADFVSLGVRSITGILTELFTYKELTGKIFTVLELLIEWLAFFLGTAELRSPVHFVDNFLAAACVLIWIIYDHLRPLRGYVSLNLRITVSNLYCKFDIDKNIEYFVPCEYFKGICPGSWSHRVNTTRD